MCNLCTPACMILVVWGVFGAEGWLRRSVHCFALQPFSSGVDWTASLFCWWRGWAVGRIWKISNGCEEVISNYVVDTLKYYGRLPHFRQVIFIDSIRSTLGPWASCNRGRKWHQTLTAGSEGKMMWLWVSQGNGWREGGAWQRA